MYKNKSYMYKNKSIKKMYNPVIDWKNFLQHEDYNYLYQFVENIKNSTKNDKILLLLGPSRTGKSTLINQILTYIGHLKCTNQLLRNIDLLEVRHLVILDGQMNYVNLQEINKIIDLQNITNIISTSNEITSLNNNLTMTFCKIIIMNHRF